MSISKAISEIYFKVKPGEYTDWTEEDKARLDLALLGHSNKPVAWVRADGLLIGSKEEADKEKGYAIYPLYGHPLSSSRE